MSDDILQTCLPIFLVCIVKYVVGTGIALAAKLSFWQHLFSTGLGGTIGVTLFTYTGDALRIWWRSLRKKWQQRRANRSSVTQTDINTDTNTENLDEQKPSLAQRIWQKYGFWGAVVLTPPLLGPQVGPWLAIGNGASTKKTAGWMITSIWIWSAIFASVGGLYDTFKQISSNL